MLWPPTRRSRLSSDLREETDELVIQLKDALAQLGELVESIEADDREPERDEHRDDQERTRGS